jgi:thiamine biosynthesis lipoprotein ApbE
MRLLDPRNETDVLARYLLKGTAVSASARVTEQHILDPRTGRPPATRWIASWVFAPTAGLADALSTAFIVMTEKETEDYCRRHDRVCAILVAEENNKPVVRVVGDLKPHRFKWEIEL